MKKRSIIIFIMLLGAVLIHRYNPILFDFNYIHNLYGPNILLRDQSLIPRLIGLASIGLTCLFGPFFCGWICPFGTFQKLVGYLGKAFIKQKQLPIKLHKGLSYIKYFILIAVVFLSLNDNIIAYIHVDPYHGLFKLLIGGLTLYAGITLIIVIVLSLFLDRPFCNYFCPYGAGLNLIGSFRVFPIKRTDACINCHKCDNSCPVQITLTDHEIIKDVNCLSCNQCHKVCPKPKALTNQIRWSRIPVNLVLMIVLIIVTWPNKLPALEPVTIPLIELEPATIIKTSTSTENIYLPGHAEFINIADLSEKNLTALKIHQEKIAAIKAAEEQAKLEAEKRKQEEAAKAAQSKYYHDGVYQSTVNGYQPNMTVAVTIENDKITKIEVLEHEETRSYFNFASPKIIKSIISQNSPEVKVIAGATYTSRGIKNAVRNCLLKAKK